MLSVLLCTLLLVGLSSPVVGQQLNAIINNIGMKLVLIHPGSFTMGSPEGERGRQENETPHEVTISRSYYLGVYEVTQGQYEKVVGENPSIIKGSQLPVEAISWHEAVSFCKQLSELPQEKAADRVYRLPTEAEWEYACRATSITSYSFGNTAELLEEYAWFAESRPDGTTRPVGEKKPNRWGLYDMHGNIREWCLDEFAAYPSGAATDPQGPILSTRRVLRGGSWGYDAARCRSAYRDQGNATFRTNDFGFRVAMALPTKQPEVAKNK